MKNGFNVTTNIFMTKLQIDKTEIYIRGLAFGCTPGWRRVISTEELKINIHEITDLE